MKNVQSRFLEFGQTRRAAAPEKDNQVCAAASTSALPCDRGRDWHSASTPSVPSIGSTARREHVL